MAGLLLMGGFLVARWGNEPFERIRPGEVAAMDYVYAHDDPTVRLLWLSNDTRRQRDAGDAVGRQGHGEGALRADARADRPGAGVRAGEGAQGRGPELVSDGQPQPGRRISSWTWATRRPGSRGCSHNLDSRKELKQVLTNDDVTMYTLRDQPEGKVREGRPRPDRAAGDLDAVVGAWAALAAVALILLLSAREVVRVAVRPGVRQLRWLQSSFWFALPLLAVLLAALVQRFLTMK